jgi:hypothetical protein
MPLPPPVTTATRPRNWSITIALSPSRGAHTTPDRLPSNRDVIQLKLWNTVCHRFAVSPACNILGLPRGAEVRVFLDMLRLAVAFGGVALLVAFWYWMMDSLGTF